MNRFKCDFSSRFRILKGGKISLVVSAMLVGAVSLSEVKAQDMLVGINTILANDTQIVTTADITHTASVTIANDSYTGTDIQLNHDIAITNNSAVVITNLTDGSVTIASNKTISSENSSTAAALSLFDSGTVDFSGDILNNGTLAATSTGSYTIGIRLNGITLDQASVTNNGTIDVEGSASGVFGIELAGGDFVSSTLTNNGDILVDATASVNAVGIALSGTVDQESIITNGVNGAIIVNGIANVSGISVATLNWMSQIINDGEITLTSTSGESNAFGIVTSVDSAVGRGGNLIENNGDITITTSSNDNNIGIYVDGSDLIADGGTQSQIINSGTITLTDTYEADVFGIKVEWNLRDSSTIENSGTISVTANDERATGIYVNGYLRDTSSIVNSGAIEATSHNSIAEGIIIDDGIYSDDVTITNSGTITVDGAAGEASLGILAWGLYSGPLGRYATPTITNSGTITATVGGEADVYGYAVSGSGILNNTYTDSTHYGKIYGNIDFSGTLNNDGLVSLPYNANSDTSSASVDTFINGATGVLEIGVLTDGTTTTHSQLETDDATFEDGSTIKVNVLAASTNVAMIVGETLHDVVEADNFLTIEGTLNVIDNSLLLDFEYVQDGYTIDLNIVSATDGDGDPISIVNTTVAGGGATPAKAAAQALQTIFDSGNYPAMTTVLNSLPANPVALAKAVESTTPQTTGATVGAASQISGGIAGIVEQRQNITMGGGLSSGDEMFTNKNAWVKPFGSIGSQNDKDGLNGFDLKAYGIGMGIDGEYKPNQTLGFAFFYTAANVEVNNVTQKSDLDVFTTLVYGNMPVIDEKTRFMYQLGYAWQKTNGERSVFTGDTAKSDYTSKTASLDLKLMRNYQINDRLLLQPMIEGTYRHFTSPSYSETGAGALNLEVQKFTSTELLLGLGTIAHYKLTDDSKIVGNINVGYDIHDRQQSVTASYQGASGVSFDTDGIDNGRWNYDVGVGYEMNMNENSNLNFSYNLQGQGSDFRNNTVSAKYTYKF